MKMKIILVILLVGLIGCTTYQSFILPSDSYSEAQVVLSRFNNLPLKNTYSIQILTKDEMMEIYKSRIPHIDTGSNIIYIEDSYLRYLYNHRGGKFYRIRKRDLACIIAHEICHKEYSLPDNPLEVHLQVDEKAIEMLSRFDIDWYDYSGALIRANDYIKTREGDVAYFIKNIPNLAGASAALYFGIGIIWEEDLATRYHAICRYYGGPNWYGNKELEKRLRHDFTRKSDWDFN